ncbi:uncharacterized protein Z519_12115 [Cladophialophora bantiana CBS 173.52]|uniref:Uncharacterized protein n=1 Tax=Cladophialophora bantiana (strain ATCC 10958 / CBS 173.52 / CDC B-1940 / NIH 8579) TaxID=1442370 RepID=A0A0D2FKJ4_CLAB1|nr:uncharacterized protein Z519_12115 [Cladophialophora bantiana CBS 173.52]KIW87212.1 hypothetical protein Z519_12115 [Cladophialophora bantiana CBS 173.52]
MNQFCDSHNGFAILQTGQIQPTPNVLSASDNLNAQNINSLLDDGTTIYVQPTRPKKSTEPSSDSTKKKTQLSSNPAKENA